MSDGLPQAESDEGPVWPAFVGGTLLTLGFNFLTVVLSWGASYLLMAAARMEQMGHSLDGIAAIVSLLSTGWTVGVGYFQFFYVLPAALVAHFLVGKKGWAPGILTGAAITFVLNSCCIALVVGTVAFCFVLVIGMIAGMAP